MKDSVVICFRAPGLLFVRLEDSGSMSCSAGLVDKSLNLLITLAE